MRVDTDGVLGRHSCSARGQWRDHTGDVTYDRAFWREIQKIHEANVPILFWTCWRDIVEIETIHAYAALHNAYAKHRIYTAVEAGQPTTPLVVRLNADKDSIFPLWLGDNAVLHNLEPRRSPLLMAEIEKLVERGQRGFASVRLGFQQRLDICAF
jgi:hypothetical protein